MRNGVASEIFYIALVGMWEGGEVLRGVGPNL